MRFSRWLTPKQWANRRQVIGMTIAALFVMGANIQFIEDASARVMHGGVASSVVSNAITTMTLLNTSGTTQAIGLCTQTFGHPFKKGDIPTGQYPVFKTTVGGTVFPFSVSIDKAVWSDGSLKHASFRLRLPVTIAGSASLGLSIYNGGSAPTPSGLTTAAFAAGGLDLNELVTAQDNMGTPGTDWISNLNQGIAAAWPDNVTFMDGDAGITFEILAKFRQSGADHGQLEGWWYVDALPDSTGALGCIRHLCRVIQPLYNETSPASDYRSFTAFKTRNGITTLVDHVAALPAPQTFTYTGGATIGGNFIPQAMNATASGMESCIACKVTNIGGALPTGLNSTSLYAVAVIDATHIGVGDSFSGVAHDGSGACITPSAAGSGTNTVTFYPMVSQFGSLWTAQADGRYNFIQGAGSISADSTIVCQMNNAYWCRTQCLPPFAVSTYTPASNATFTYYPGTAGPVGRNVSATGEREDIGQINSWYARHIFTQAAVDERAVRVIGLVGGHLPIALYDKTTRSIPVGNNGHANNGVTYSGMPACNVSIRWDASLSHTSGITNPANANVVSQGWTATDTSHMPGFSYYYYLLTGEPQAKRMLAEYGSNGICSQYPNQDTAIVDPTHNTIGGIRNASINGTVYRGIFSGESGVRTVAWAARDIGVCGIAKFRNPSWNTYFADVLADIVNGMAAYRGMLVAGANSYVTTNGLWDEGAGNNGGMWGTGYMIGSFTMIAGITESAGALAQANYLVKWPTHVCNTMSSYLVGCYRQTIRKGPNSNDLYSTSDEQIGFWAWGVSWDFTTQLFTLTSAPPSTPAPTFGNDMIFVWNPSEGGPPPAGMNSWQGYHVVNRAGNDFKLSVTVGGTPTVLTDTASAGLYGQPTTAQCPSAGALDNTTASGYQCNVTSASNYLNSISGTVDAPYLADMTARIHTFPSYVANFNTDPKYATQATYV